MRRFDILIPAALSSLCWIIALVLELSGYSPRDQVLMAVCFGIWACLNSSKAHP
jgi:hypothetical protein